MAITYHAGRRIQGLEEDRIGATASQGNNGGSGVTAEPYPAGGGGGAGSAGGSGSGTTAGDGGDGLQSDITGTNIYYAGGGGGGVVRSGHTVGSGGLGGGANGAYGASHATYYGGGGGGSCDACPTSGNGYQGIVILQFTTSGTSYSTTGSPVVDTSSVSGKTILKYTGSGSFILSSGTPDVRYLVVAGGGGGGAGGGGAGGFVTGEKLALTSGTYTITVGSGGTGGNGGGGNGNSGNDSVFSDITATGGGYGGSGSKVGGDGGSGGGANNGASGGSTVLVTTVSATIPTDVQVGSRFEETDTRKMYDYGDHPTFEDNTFSSGWTSTDSTNVNTNTTTKVIDANVPSTGAQTGVLTYPLGYTLENNFVLEFKMEITSYTDNTDNTHQEIYIGITNNTSAYNVSQQFIGMSISNAGTGGGNDRYALQEFYNEALTANNGQGDSTNRPNANDIRYHRISKSGSTLTYSIYSDSSYSTLVETISGTATDTYSLNTISVKLRALDGTQNGVLTVEIDDIKIYNGVGTPSNSWKEIGT